MTPILNIPVYHPRCKGTVQCIRKARQSPSDLSVSILHYELPQSVVIELAPPSEHQKLWLEASNQFLKTVFVSNGSPVTGLVSCSDNQRSMAALRKGWARHVVEHMQRTGKHSNTSKSVAPSVTRQPRCGSNVKLHWEKAHRWARERHGALSPSFTA